MYAHPYLLQLIAEERNRDMRSWAATSSRARQARRARRTRSAASPAAAALGSQRLLHTIPQPRKPEEASAHRAA